MAPVRASIVARFHPGMRLRPEPSAELRAQTQPACLERVASAAPVSAFHTRAPVLRKIAPVCPASVAMTAPVAASHTRAVLSSEAVTMRDPSGLNAAFHTQMSCPDSVVSVAPLATSQTRAVPSKEVVATRRPSGLNTALFTTSSCPASVASKARVLASHSRAVLSFDAVTMGNRRAERGGLHRACMSRRAWRERRPAAVPDAARSCPTTRHYAIRLNAALCTQALCPTSVVSEAGRGVPDARWRPRRRDDARTVGLDAALFTRPGAQPTPTENNNPASSRKTTTRPGPVNERREERRH